MTATRKARKRNTPMRQADIQAEADALQLRLQGWSYRRIAEQQGCTVSTAFERVERALLHVVPAEAVEQVRKMECERYEAVQGQVLAAMAVLTQAEVPDVDGIAKLTGAFAKVADRKAKLLGLDAPQQHKFTSELDERIEGLLSQLGVQAPAPVQA